MTAKWIQDFFVGSDKNALELDSGDGYTTVWLYISKPPNRMLLRSEFYGMWCVSVNPVSFFNVCHVVVVILTKSFLATDTSALTLGFQNSSLNEWHSWQRKIAKGKWIDLKRWGYVQSWGVGLGVSLGRKGSEGIQGEQKKETNFTYFEFCRPATFHILDWNHNWWMFWHLKPSWEKGDIWSLEWRKEEQRTQRQNPRVYESNFER